MFWITVSPKGTFLGAKKNFLSVMIGDADEVKWVVPATPTEIIKQFRPYAARHYLQPVNGDLEINYDNLKYAKDLAVELDLPISIQLHKVFNWR
jgi:hypothetical protein